MDAQTLYQLDQQAREMDKQLRVVLSQDWRRLRVALSALHGFASLPSGNEDGVSFARRELESAIQVFEEHFQRFAAMVFTHKVEELNHAPE